MVDIKGEDILVFVNYVQVKLHIHAYKSHMQADLHAYNLISMILNNPNVDIPHYQHSHNKILKGCQ